MALDGLPMPPRWPPDGPPSSSRADHIRWPSPDRLQVRAILQQVRPDRQALLFSATFPPALERLARDSLSEPIRLAIGTAGDANEDVTQLVEVLPTEELKWPWLAARLEHFLQQGTVLVFVSTRLQADGLAAQLQAHMGRAVVAIHGEKSQAERQETLYDFKRGKMPLLVATDVASRGLDIPTIKTVINFDVAKRLDDHTHRIGRTGRAGATDGTAYTLLTAGEMDAAVDMVRSLRTARQVPSEELLQLARRSRRWAASGLDDSSIGGGSGGGDGVDRGCGSGGAGEAGRGGCAPHQFAPPSQHRVALLEHSASDPVARAQAFAARLSSQLGTAVGANGYSSHQFAPPPSHFLPPPRPPPPQPPPPPPPPPPPRLSTSAGAWGGEVPPGIPPALPTCQAAAVAAARAAAEAIASRLSASAANCGAAPPPPAPPDSGGGARSSRWS